MRDSSEALLGSWIVELYHATQLMQTVVTNANGAYEFTNVAPGSGYEVRFREPTSNAVYGVPVTNEGGLAHTPGAIGPENPGGADPRGGTLEQDMITAWRGLDGEALLDQREVLIEITV